MPSFQTKYFDLVSFERSSVLEFPHGLPGFEERRSFVALQFEDRRPIVFLQSIEDPELCFLTVPVGVVDADYHLQVNEEDRSHAGLPPLRPLRIGDDVLCLAVLSVRESGPTANLLAPLVINLHNRKGVQAIAAESGYSHQHPLETQAAPACA